MKLPAFNLTAFWKWFWFVLAAIVAKGPDLVQFATALEMPTAVRIASFVIGLAGLLLTLQIHPMSTGAARKIVPPASTALLMLAICLLAGCPQAVRGETLALDLTQAACSAADTTGNNYVIMGCNLAIAAENGVISLTNVFVSVPAAQASAFAAAHPESVQSKALVKAYQAIHPSATVPILPGAGH